MNEALTAGHERNSAPELLRITAMLMIIASHLSQHGGFSFSADSITINRLWQQILFLGGQRGNDIFILISGYFLIESSSGIKFYKLFKLWIILFFWSLVVSCALVISGSEVLSPVFIIKSLMPLTQGWWWFPRVYFVMYLFHPYLNIFLRSLNRVEYKKFLMMIIICWSIIPALT